MLSALAILCVIACSALAAEKSDELKVLNRFIGTWHGRVSVTQPNGSQTTNAHDPTIKWVCEDSYVQCNVGELFATLWTYDPDDKSYRCWYFTPGSHKPVVITMIWNSDDTAFSGNADLENGGKITTTWKFTGDSTLVFSISTKEGMRGILTTGRMSK